MNNENPIGEHHVERAFREHAETYKCESFHMTKSDPLKQPTILEMFDGKDIKLFGEYTWCGRKFEFGGSLHAPPYSGGVWVRAFSKIEPMIGSLQMACELPSEFTGYGVDLSCLDLVDPSKAVFRAINTSVSDHNFDVVMVNSISDRLNSALSRFEENFDGKKVILKRRK